MKSYPRLLSHCPLCNPITCVPYLIDKSNCHIPLGGTAKYAQATVLPSIQTKFYRKNITRETGSAPPRSFRLVNVLRASTKAHCLTSTFKLFNFFSLFDWRYCRRGNNETKTALKTRRGTDPERRNHCRENT